MECDLSKTSVLLDRQDPGDAKVILFVTDDNENIGDTLHSVM